MKYPLVTAAAKTSEDFEQVNEGIWVTEAALENIETNLSTLKANNQVLVEEGTRLATERNDAQAELATANATIAERDATITALTAQVEELKKGPAGSFNSTVKDADEIGSTKKATRTSVDIEADKLRAMRPEPNY